MRTLGLGFLLGLAILVGDQVTKWLVVEALADGPNVEVTSFFNLVLVGNRGISFGVLNSGAAHNRWLLSGLAILIGAGLLVWLVRERRALPRLAIFAVLGGALGNLIDRLRLGYVVDFLDFHVGTYHWPAFNVADSAIVVGAILLLIDGLGWSGSGRTTASVGRAKERG